MCGIFDFFSGIVCFFKTHFLILLWWGLFLWGLFLWVLLTSFFFWEKQHFKVTQGCIINVLSVFYTVQYGSRIFPYSTNPFNFKWFSFLNRKNKLNWLYWALLSFAFFFQTWMFGIPGFWELNILRQIIQSKQG